MLGRVKSIKNRVLHFLEETFHLVGQNLKLTEQNNRILIEQMENQAALMRASIEIIETTKQLSDSLKQLTEAQQTVARQLASLDPSVLKSLSRQLSEEPAPVRSSDNLEQPGTECMSQQDEHLPVTSSGRCSTAADEGKSRSESNFKAASIQAESAPASRSLVIGLHAGGGFFSNFNLVMTHLVGSADKYEGVKVEWIVPPTGAAHFAYGTAQDGNIWEHFFEQLPTADKVTAVPDMVNKFKDLTMTSICAYYKYQSEEDWRNAYHQTYEKYIRVQPHILEGVDQLSSKIACRPCLAVHARHPLHVVEQPEHTQPSIDESIAMTKRLLRSWPSNSVVFLITDVEEAVRAFTKAFGARLIVQPGVTRTSISSRNELHVQNPKPSVILGEQILIDALVVARCDAFLHITSNISTAVGYINPQLKMIYASDDLLSKPVAELERVF